MAHQNLFEIAHLDIGGNDPEQFQARVLQAAPLFKRAKGCRSMQLVQKTENPNHFVLVVGWATLENHMVDFRESDDFQTWRGLVGKFFASPPQVHHIHDALSLF